MAGIVYIAVGIVVVLFAAMSLVGEYSENSDANNQDSHS
jgi:hypothetical protein